MKKSHMMLIGLAFGMFCCAGCDPDEMEVTVSTGSIEKALAGKPASAKLKLLFSSSGSDKEGKMERIVAIANRYLGESGEAVLNKTDSSSKVVASLKVPVLAAGLERSMRDALAWVVVKGEVIAVVPNSERLAQLNAEISDVDSSCTITLSPEKTMFHIVGSSDERYVFSAVAAKVDGIKYLEARKPVEEGDSVTFELTGGSDGAYGGTLVPQVRVNPKAAVIPQFVLKSE